MKRKLLISMLLLLLGVITHAQDSEIKPSQQAQGILESKNAMVDHATGLFHYKVPIHEIKIGNFTLPISFDYTAKSVKRHSNPGPIGHNWNINTGGVITRTVRGGRQDEYLEKLDSFNYKRGHIYVAGSYPLYQYAVNDRIQDGEADIFTASFNGRNISFILRYYYNGEITVHFLEPTDVKIKCLFINDRGKIKINRWELTDEQGYIYNFQIHDNSGNFREAGLEGNQISTSYISSWFLESIEICEDKRILYEYYDNVDRVNGVFLYEYSSFYTRADYIYETPIIYRPNDFNKYKKSFMSKIDLANRYVNLHVMKYYDKMSYYESLISRYSLIDNSDPWIIDDMEKETWYIKELVRKTQQSFGVLYDFEHYNRVYDEMIKIVDHLISYCKSTENYSYARLAIPDLEDAKKILLECTKEEIKTYFNSTYQYGSQVLKSPMIKKIISKDCEIEFKYRDGTRSMKSYVLDKVIVSKACGEVVKNIDLHRDTSSKTAILDGFSFLDKENKIIDNLKFEYFKPSRPYYMYNIFGDAINYSGNLTDYNKPENNYLTTMYSDSNASMLVLNKITSSDKAEINLYYSNNSINEKYFKHTYNKYSSLGGIKIDGITIKDKIRLTTDNISYRYSPGEYVHPKPDNYLEIQYEKGLKDRVSFGRLINTGPDPYVKYGNDGIYYPKVKEYIGGKGHVVYNFITPNHDSEYYNHWNIGKPISKSYYNSSGKLKKVIRYEYDDSIAAPNKQVLLQIRPYEYAGYSEKLIEKYKKIDSTFFMDNMKNRLNPILPKNQSYKILLNYTSYLKRISEYNFEDSMNTNFDKDNDYLKTSSNYTITEYDYDLSKSKFPIKTTTINSDGTKYINEVRRAKDFDNSVHESIPILKDRNQLSLPITEQLKVVNKNGIERIIFDKVNIYKRTSIYRCNLLLHESYEYMPKEGDVLSTSGLFNFNKEFYDKTIIEYNRNNYPYPHYIENKEGNIAYLYGKNNDNMILNCLNISKNSIMANDYMCNYSTGNEFTFNNAPSGKYKLFIVPNNPLLQNVNFTVNNVSHSFKLESKPYSVQIFDLDLTNYPLTNNILLTNSNKDIAYIAMVPIDAEFEATSYNPDGTIFCKFNQNGQLERYEYDAAGRVIKVYDNEKNLLKEFKYNVVLK